MLADVKRLLERLQGDAQFKQQLIDDAPAAARELGLTTDLEQLRPLWEPDPSVPLHPGVLAYQQESQRKLAFREQVRQESAPSHPRLQSWRQRQMNRCALQLGSRLSEAIVHPPWSVELTRGCSVGCWFCGLSAVGLSAVYAYTEENRRSWGELLDLMDRWLGSAARWGFCYWATDPLDNPDYEKFCTDFSERLGMFPQTTTAQAWRNPERTRQLLLLSEQRGCVVNRFSILTLSLLKKVYQQFTPEEMLRVECVFQNREAPIAKAQAGHAREPKRAGAAKAAQVADSSSTIACVSGFVINMLDQSVELVTPCPADERWPNGYVVLQSGRFEDIAQLDGLVAEWVAALPQTVADLPRVRLAAGLQVLSQPEGVLFQGPEQGNRFSAAGYSMAGLVTLLQEGTRKADEIAFLMQFQYGVPERMTEQWLNTLFERGWLDEGP